MSEHSEKQHHEWSASIQILKDYQTTIILTIFAVLAVAWYYFWSRNWRKYRLTHRDVPHRLGADHGAHVSICIEYSDTQLSVSEQYEKAKNKEIL